MNAPRITVQDLEDAIAYEYYVRGSQATDRTTVVLGSPKAMTGCPVTDALDRLTICIIVLHNGYTVVGTSSCVASENFDEAKGRQLAREKALDQLWTILGYQLREQLWKELTTHTHGPSRSKEGY